MILLLISFNLSVISRLALKHSSKDIGGYQEIYNLLIYNSIPAKYLFSRCKYVVYGTDNGKVTALITLNLSMI